MLVRVGCQFEYEVTEATASLWQVRPHANSAHRIVTASWEPTVSGPHLPRCLWQCL